MVGCFFQLSLVSDVQYIRASSKSINKARFIAYDVHFGIGHGGKNNVKRGVERECHITKASALSRMDGGIAGTEVAKSHLPLGLTDDFSKMVWKITLPKRYRAWRIKTTHVIKALAPYLNRVNVLLL